MAFNNKKDYQLDAYKIYNLFKPIIDEYNYYESFGNDSSFGLEHVLDKLKKIYDNETYESYRYEEYDYKENKIHPSYKAIELAIYHMERDSPYYNKYYGDQSKEVIEKNAAVKKAKEIIIEKQNEQNEQNLKNNDVKKYQKEKPKILKESYENYQLKANSEEKQSDSTQLINKLIDYKKLENVEEKQSDSTQLTNKLINISMKNSSSIENEWENIKQHLTEVLDREGFEDWEDVEEDMDVDVLSHSQIIGYIMEQYENKPNEKLDPYKIKNLIHSKYKSDPNNIKFYIKVKDNETLFRYLRNKEYNDVDLLKGIMEDEDMEFDLSLIIDDLQGDENESDLKGLLSSSSYNKLKQLINALPISDNLNVSTTVSYQK